MKISSGETSEKWNTYLKTFLFILSKGLLRSLKVDIWYVIFTRQFFATFLQFFREITGNESEWFSNSLRFDYAILQQWEENCWRTSNAVPRARKVRGKERKGGGKRERERKRKAWDTVKSPRNVVWRDIDLSKGRKDGPYVFASAKTPHNEILWA